MATYVDYAPIGTIARAMFNFDELGVANFRLAGVVRVSVSDSFSYQDRYEDRSYSSFDSEIYTSAANEYPWSAGQLDNIKTLLGIFSRFAAIDFVGVTDYDQFGTRSIINPEDVGRSGLSDINIGWIYRSDVDFAGISGIDSEDALGYAGSAGDIFLNQDTPKFLGDYSLEPTSRAAQTLMHELGHSLGLSHPHSDYTASGPIITSDYAATQHLGFDQLGFRTSSALDMVKEYFSIMSYDDQGYGRAIANAYTPMILDVIALQQAYGEGSGTSGPFDDTITPGNLGYRTYFDSGGNDTVDLSTYDAGAVLRMGVTITGAGHLVGVSMSSEDAGNIARAAEPHSLRWFYGEFENAMGSAQSDRIDGTDAANHIDGASGDDTIDGRGGNDQLVGGPGNDSLDGGAGIDTVLYAGQRADFSINRTATGFSVSDRSGAEGPDALASVERVRFADAAVALDIDGNGGRAYRLYQAAFDRQPDLAGLGDWIEYLDRGGSLADAAAGFVDSPEFKALYGANPGTSDIVTKFYNNVLHRAPEPAGFDYWMNQLDAGLQTLPVALSHFSESPENQANLIGIIGNGFVYTPWHG